MTSEEILSQLAAVVVLGVGAQWLAWRLRLPSILLLLVVGFVVGPVAGLVDPDDLLGDLLAPLVSLSVAVILFEGGLSLRLSDLPHVGNVVRNLISVGALITWVVGGLTAYLALDLDASMAVLLGAILVVTGPTVIVPLLDHVRPVGRVGAILKWEGITIDPLAAVLAVLVFEAILVGEVEEATAEVVLGLARTFMAGVGFGLLAAVVITLLLRRYLIPDFLQNPVTLMAVIGAHAASNWVQGESGLLAATVMGIALANQRAVSIEHIVEFKESLRVLLIGVLFVVLAARLETDDLSELGAGSVVFLATLMLIGRPLSVLASTLGSALGWRERAFLAWMAPRGIVAASIASVFSLRLAEEGQADAERLVPLTFIVIVGTIAIYGLTATPLARWLEVARPNPQGCFIVGAHPWARAIGKALAEAEIDVIMLDSNRHNVSDARMEGLTAHHANVLSEQVLEEMDLGGIGRMLALTPNDEVNSLAAQRFSNVFGRAEVYQLAPGPETDAARTSGEEKIPQHLRGRLLFGPEATYSFLEERFADGFVVKATGLSEEFDYEAFRAEHGTDAVPLFLVTPRRELLIFAAEAPPTPRPGYTIISLIRPRE